VPLAVRCNDIKDCADYSDENACKLFDIDETYYRKVSTFTVRPIEKKRWIKEAADLHIILPSEHRLIKDGLRMYIAIRGA
jgi:4-hydroxyphenylpyruvate dioxygenase-like putative hemolysin